MSETRQASDYEQITVSTTAVGFTAATIGGAASKGFGKVQTVVVSVENAPIRFTVDGTIPTSSTGALLNSGDVIKVRGEHDVATFKAIRQSGTDALITCQYFK